jgi:UDP:flavonoid glycosyltransferase YjiC (YdhE family)
VVSPDAESWAKGAGSVPDLNTVPEHLMMLRSTILYTPMSVPWATETFQQIESYQPSVVVADLITPGAGIAAEAAGTPRVMALTTVPVHRLLPGLPVPGRGAAPGEDDTAAREEFMRLTREAALPPLNAARTAMRLDPDDHTWAWEDRADRVIVLSSRAFDFPAAEYPPNVVYTGTIRPAASSDGWGSPWSAADARPLVAVSGTTTGLSGLWFGVFQAAANALIELDMRGLLTIGPLNPQILPQNEALAYRSFVPHSAVLPEASAMVTQCGHGATMSALRHGLPMVCAPVFADQPDISARVEFHGAGVRLTTLSSANEFRDAISAVLNERRYREAAAALGAELANEDGALSAADEIEAVARRTSAS